METPSDDWTPGRNGCEEFDLHENLTADWSIRRGGRKRDQKKGKKVGGHVGVIRECCHSSRKQPVAMEISPIHLCISLLQLQSMTLKICMVDIFIVAVIFSCVYFC